MALKAVTGEHGLLFVKETLKKVELAVRLCTINRIVGGAGRSERSFCIDGHHLGPKSVAVIRNSGVAALQGFGYCGSLCKFNPDQSFWPLYSTWPLFRGGR